MSIRPSQGAGREDEALVQLKKVLELDENQVVALVSIAMIYADKGDICAGGLPLSGRPPD